MRNRSRSLLALLLALSAASCGGACQGGQGGSAPPDRGAGPLTASTAASSATGGTSPAATTAPVVRKDPAWALHPLMGRCVATARDFVKDIAGPDGLNDENLKTRPASPLTDGSTWVIDATPGTNNEWYLLQPGAKGDLCLTLHVPIAAQVLLSESAQGQAAESQTQASPGFPAKAVRFERPSGEAAFHPVTCTEIRFEGDSETRKDVPCVGFFEPSNPPEP